MLAPSNRHEQLLREVIESAPSWVISVHQLTSQMRSGAPTPPPTPCSGPSDSLDGSLTGHVYSIYAPEYYTGEVGTCSRFLLQHTLVFDQQPSAYVVGS